MRVSGTWANSTYFYDADGPAPKTPPNGFGGVLTRAEWKGVLDFARIADAKIISSVAISPGVRDARWSMDSGTSGEVAGVYKSVGRFDCGDGVF